MKKNKSIVNKWLDLRNGTIDTHCQKKSYLSEILVDSSFLSNLVTNKSFKFVLNKPLSSLEWHPRHNSILIGSREGEVSFVDITSQSVKQCIRGKGRGQQITGIKFDLLDNKWYYTSSTSGKLIKHTIDGKEDIILKDSYDCEELFYSSARFSCLDVCSDRKLLISGDSKGFIHLLPSCESTKSGSNSNQSVVPIHSSNVLHCEFNKFNTNLFITASIDCTAKLWDIRMLSNSRTKPVLTIRQTKPLNSATFSLNNGSTLLVTNHFDEISVFRGPDWQLERCIRHNHEQTQRFCLLKPMWHPLCDLFIIGSFTYNPLVSGQYLEKPQTIDVFDAKKGVILKSISDGNPGVITMSCFNSCGDLIAGMRGQNLIIFESING